MGAIHQVGARAYLPSWQPSMGGKGLPSDHTPLAISVIYANRNGSNTRRAFTLIYERCQKHVSGPEDKSHYKGHVQLRYVFPQNRVAAAAF